MEKYKLWFKRMVIILTVISVILIICGLALIGKSLWALFTWGV